MGTAESKEKFNVELMWKEEEEICKNSEKRRARYKCKEKFIIASNLPKWKETCDKVLEQGKFDCELRR